MNLLELHNRERSQRSIGELVEDSILMEYAQKHANTMAKRRRMVHSKFKNLRGYKYLGENIARGQKDTETVMKTWMNSRGHRGNILNKRYTLIGFGMKDNYWCVLFANK